MHGFTAPLYRVGVLWCVDVPPAVTARLGATGRVAVRGLIERVPFRTTLMPRGRGLHRLFVRRVIWKPLGLRLGAKVRVRLERDTDAEDVPVPSFLDAAFHRRPQAKVAFLDQTPALRREIVGWLAGAKRPETRERRLEMILDRLETGDLRRQI